MEHNVVHVLKAVSDITRLRILNLLRHGDLCVCEIEILLGINQSNASRHLLKLTNAGVVRYYKKAKYVYYRVDEHSTTAYPFIVLLLETEAEKLSECREDTRRLQVYKGQGFTCEDLKSGSVCFEC